MNRIFSVLFLLPLSLCCIASCASGVKSARDATAVSSTNTAPSMSTSSPQAASNHASTPPILGMISWTDWQKHAGWPRYRDSDYKPNTTFTQRIEQDMAADSISFVLFAGSWCDDSQIELPRLFQVFEAANINADKITMYGVDENKNDPTGTAERLGIYKVPTLIAFKRGRETGRIIEHPRTNWELDVIVIMER